MRPYKQRCPHCGGEVAPTRIDVEFIEPDGCRLWAHDRNVRTRDTVGNGNGSLEDEYRRGVRTPWTSKDHKEQTLEHLEGELLAFARSLPYVKVEGEQ